MSQKILQININFSGVSMSDLKQAWLAGAQPIADTPGLQWKIWLMDETRTEVGGIYLFDDLASMEAFLNGPIVAELKSDPTLSNVSLKPFDVMEEHTAITRGPVRKGIRV